ncbi:hypothetical protein OKW49_006744 [Paraburkholderia youngii]|uniref:hypothetical protein n=1 Tax=Paraburkholderia youngii TaxID=2782701 RepID=UPI003D21E72F
MDTKALRTARKTSKSDLLCIVLLILPERPETRRLHFGEVREQIFAAVIREASQNVYNRLSAEPTDTKFAPHTKTEQKVQANCLVLVWMEHRLYSLFIDDKLPVSNWLEIDNLEDLKGQSRQECIVGVAGLAQVSARTAITDSVTFEGRRTAAAFFRIDPLCGHPVRRVEERLHKVGTA